jgi:hypothetical protein
VSSQAGIDQCRSIVQRSLRLLTTRLATFEARLECGDETAWPEYRDTLGTLVELLSALQPERQGAFLTTAEMAQRLQITPKTLLKRKRNGDVRPAFERGKLIRWRGDETARR